MTSGAARVALDGVGSASPADNANGVAVQVADSGRAVLAAVRSLDAAGVAVESLEVREPTLDDVFLELTGHTAQADASERS